MIVYRALAGLTIGGTLVASVAVAQSLDPHGPLVVPTPEGPKLSVPEIAVPPPLTLRHARPLQIQPQQGRRPSLNVLPRPETVEPGDEESEESEAGEAPPGPYLQHGR
jgi:hypothetical protein